MNFRSSLLFIFIGLYVAGCGGSSERQAAHLERGKAELAQNHYDKARVEFNNVLQIDPKNEEARFLLAGVYEKLQDYKDAAGHYLRLIEDNPRHVQARIRMGEIYALSQGYDQAMQQVDAVLKIEPGNVDALTLRGGVRARQGDIDAAWTDAQTVLHKVPGHVNATVLEASIDLRRKQPEQAIAVLNDSLARNQGNMVVRVMLAKVYSDLGQHDQAVEQLTQIVKSDPTSLANRLQLAAYLSNINRLDESEKLLRETVQALPDDVNAKLALAEFQATRRDRKQAESELKGWIEKQPDVPEFQFALASLYEVMGDNALAKAAYRAVIDRAGVKPAGLTARSRLAVVFMRERDFKQAGALIAEVLKENPRDKEALQLHGVLATTQGDYATAIGDFRSILKDDPGSSKVQRLLARTQLLDKEPELAKDTLKKAIDGSPNDLDVRGDYIALLAQQGDLEGAIAQLKEVLKLSPQNFAALETLFKAYAVSRNWSAAQQIVEQLKSAYPDKSHGYYFAGLIHQTQNKLEDSVADFDAALQRAPDAVEPLTQLIKSYLALGQRDKAWERLEQILIRQPKHFVAIQLEGELLLADKKYDEAIARFKKTLEINPKWPIPYTNMATAYLLQKNPQAAIEAYNSGLAATDNSAVLRTALASLYETQGQFDQAIAHYELALQDAPDMAVAANNLAMLLVEQKKDTASIERARKLLDLLKGSDNPAYLDTIGWVNYHGGDIDNAIANLQKAVDAAPKAEVLQYHLGMAYFKKGNKDAAREHLTLATEGQVAYTGLEEAKSTLQQLDKG